MSAFEEEDAELTLFTLSSKCTVEGYVNANMYCLPISYMSNLPELYSKLHTFISAKGAFDLFFFRYPLACYSLIKFLKQYPNTIIFEHNTKELPEVKERAVYWTRKFRFRLSPSYFKLVKNTYLLPILNERYYGPKVLKLAKKGVAVTKEISDYEKSRYPGYTCSVLSNGIEVKKITFFRREFKRGDMLHLIMLVNSNNSWHGVDLIIDAMNRAKSQNVRLTLIGEIEEKLIHRANKNPDIVFTGHLNPSEYEKYMRQAHIGVGSLAMGRINLEEASTLKVREYFASGLPVILGYKDTDVEASDALKRVVFQLADSDENITCEKIYDWATDIYSTQNLSQVVRDAAFKQLDFSIRAKSMLSLIQNEVSI